MVGELYQKLSLLAIIFTVYDCLFRCYEVGDFVLRDFQGGYRMKRFIAICILLVSATYGNFAWPSIAGSAWKVFFETLATSGIPPQQMVKFGMVLKTVEGHGHGIDDQSVRTLAIYAMNMQALDDLAQAEAAASIGPQAVKEGMEETIDAIIEAFHLPSLPQELEPWQAKLEFLVQQEVFTKEQVQHLDLLRLSSSQNTLFGISSALDPQESMRSKVSSAVQNLQQFKAMGIEEQINVLLTLAPIRGTESGPAKFFLMGLSAGELIEKYDFLLKLLLAASSARTKNFATFYQKYLPMLFDHAPPPWLQKLESDVRAIAVEEIETKAEMEQMVRLFADGFYQATRYELFFYAMHELGISP